MPVPALKVSRPLLKFLKHYGPVLIGTLDAWPKLMEVVDHFTGDKEAKRMLQQQLAASVQALEVAVRQRRMYQILTWVFGGIAFVCFGIAMWALGRLG